MATGIKVTRIDRPELEETFADEVGAVVFKDNLVHLDLLVTRLDEPHPPEPPTGRSYPVARLVVTPNAALKVHQHLSNLLAALGRQAVVQRAATPSTSAPAPTKPN